MFGHFKIIAFGSVVLRFNRYRGIAERRISYLIFTANDRGAIRIR